MKNKILNNFEIHVVGLQKSGNHAIINWVREQCPEGVSIFLNNIALKGNLWMKTAHKEVTWPQNSNFIVKIMLKIFNYKREKVISGGFAATLARWYYAIIAALFLPAIRKENLIYSHEDFSLKDVREFREGNVCAKNFGKSLNKYTILVLRDAPNFFASRMRWMELGGYGCRNSVKDEKDKNILIGLWKEYAEEYLGETNFLGADKIVISYNRWVTDVEYRKMLSEKMGLHFSDKGLNSFWGVPFEGCLDNKNDQKLKVLERWKYYRENDYYNSIFEDKELMRLTNEIFGKIRQ